MSPELPQTAPVFPKSVDEFSEDWLLWLAQSGAAVADHGRNYDPGFRQDQTVGARRPEFWHNSLCWRQSGTWPRIAGLPGQSICFRRRRTINQTAKITSGVNPAVTMPLDSPAGSVTG